MRILFRLLVFAVAVALGLGLWAVVFPSPEKVIRTRLDEMAELISFPANQAPLSSLTAVQQICARVSSDVDIRVEARGVGQGRLQGRDNLREALLAFRSNVNGAKVEFLDVAVSLAPDKQSAEASLTVKARTPRDPDTLFQEMKITFRKMDGDWLLARAETVRTLR
jgi:hypothetical protein